MQLLVQIAVEYGNIKYVGSQPHYRTLAQLCNRNLEANRAVAVRLLVSEQRQIKLQAQEETFGVELSLDQKMALSELSQVDKNQSGLQSQLYLKNQKHETNGMNRIWLNFKMNLTHKYLQKKLKNGLRLEMKI